MKIVKVLLSLIAVLASHAHLQADCAVGGIDVWPPQGKIACNSVVIITLYDYSQNNTERFESVYKLYLYAADFTSKVKLVHKETLVGQFKVTQLLYRLDGDLIPGTVYNLGLSNGELNENEFIKIKKKKGDTTENPYIYYLNNWICSQSDYTAPTSISKPEFVERKHESYGCGPAAYARFKPNYTDSSLIAYRITLKSVNGSEQPVTCLVMNFKHISTNGSQPNGIEIQNSYEAENRLSIGHGMCAGEFMIKQGVKYKAHIQAMDASGNICKKEWDVEF